MGFLNGLIVDLLWKSIILKVDKLFKCLYMKIEKEQRQQDFLLLSHTDKLSEQQSSYSEELDQLLKQHKQQLLNLS